MMFVYLIFLLIMWRFLAWHPRVVTGVTRQAPLLIGHRGVRGAKPENTLEAFSYAFEQGLDGIETDVQKSKDGMLILYHDFVIKQGDKEHRIDNLTLEQIDALNEPYCLLKDLLDLSLNYPGTLLNLEIKSETLKTDGVERDTLKMVKAYNLEDRVLYSSFNPMSILRLRLLDPKALVGLLYSPDMNRWLRSGALAAWLHVDALHPYETQVTPEFIAKAAKKGIAVNTWTVNEPMRITSLHAAKVNAIMGDDPMVLKQAAAR